MYFIFKQSAEILQDKDYNEQLLSTGRLWSVGSQSGPGPAVSPLPQPPPHPIRNFGSRPRSLCSSRPSWDFDVPWVMKTTALDGLCSSLRKRLIWKQRMLLWVRSRVASVSLCRAGRSRRSHVLSCALCLCGTLVPRLSFSQGLRDTPADRHALGF